VKRVIGGVGEVHGLGIGEAVEVDGVLRGRRRRRAPGESIKVEGEAIEWHRG
jgi:hypothetical protein